MLLPLKFLFLIDLRSQRIQIYLHDYHSLVFIYVSFYYFYHFPHLDEIMAVLKLDSVTMGQTSWKPCSQQAWDQR